MSVIDIEGVDEDARPSVPEPAPPEPR